MNANKPTTLLLACAVLMLASIACLLNEMTFASYTLDNIASSTATLAITSTATTAPSSAQTSCFVWTNVEQGKLNLRSVSGTQYSVVAILDEGETLEVLSSGAWMKVKTRSGVIGWVSGAFCK